MRDRKHGSRQALPIPALAFAAALLMPAPGLSTVVPTCSDNLDCRKVHVSFKRGESTGTKRLLRSKALGGETLSGNLSGEWDFVQGVLVFPWQDNGQERQLVALGLPAHATGEDRYEVPGWHREAFFLDVGDGVPRLFSAVLVDPEWVPEAGDPLTTPGQLWVNDYVYYQEKEELDRDPDFYQSYDDGASLATVRWVTDDEGQVLDLVVDIYDEFVEYTYSVVPQVGDRYDPGFTAYDLDEPDIVYIYTYFGDPLAIEGDIDLRRRHYVPTGAEDGALPVDFDAGELELALILEGISDDGQGGATFGYSAPQPLGYRWAEAKATPEPDGGGGGSGAAGGGLLMLLAFGAMVSRRAPCCLA